MAQSLSVKRRRTLRIAEAEDNDNDTDWNAKVEELYLAMNMDAVVALKLPDTAAQRSVHKEALKFIAEYQAANFVRRQNFHHGVAPPSAAVLAELRPQSMASQPPATAQRSGIQRTARRLLRRFRADWGLALGRLHIREPMAADTLRGKAGQFCL